MNSLLITQSSIGTTNTHHKTLSQQHTAQATNTPYANASTTVPSTAVNPDTGCTGHFLALRDIHLLHDVRPCTLADTISVRMPNGTTSQSTHTGTIKLPDLPNEACRAYIFSDQTSMPLLSIGKLCDAGVTALYDKDYVSLNYLGKCILTGTRNHQTGLWEIPLLHNNADDILPHVLPQQSHHVGDQFTLAGRSTACTTATYDPHASNNIIRNTTDQQLMAFYQAMLGSPTMSTLETATRNGLLSAFPGLTLEKLLKNPIHTMATAKGHLDRTRRGQNSTHRTESKAQRQRRETREAAQQHKDCFPTIIEQPTDKLYVHMSPLHTHTEHMDATGKFTLQAKSANWYLLIVFNEDANYIHYELMKSRTAEDYQQALTRAHAFFIERGMTPQYEYLDNETSTLLEAHFQMLGITPNYVTPKNHSANRAERAIRTAKNHFIAILANVDPEFPAEAWDELIPQTEITLNLLRMSRITPNISALQQVCGAYDYKSHPMAPPGIKVAILIEPEVRGAFQEHALTGFYVGPALQHYRNYRVWVKSTQAIRITNSLDWFPIDVVMPGATPTEQLTAAFKDMRTALDKYMATPILRDVRQPVDGITDSNATELHNIITAFARGSAPASVTTPFQRVVDPTTPPGLPAPVHRYTRSQFKAQAQHDNATAPVTEGVTNTANANTPPPPQAAQYTAPPREPEVGPFNAILAQRKIANKLAQQKRRASVGPPLVQVETVKDRRQQNARRRARKRETAATMQKEAVTATRHAYHTAQAVCEYMKTPAHIGTWFEHFYASTTPHTFAAGQWGRSPRSSIAAQANAASDAITGKPLRYRKLLQGPDAVLWEQANREEYIRLLSETKTMAPCHLSELPVGQRACYYNPICSEKIKDGKIVKRVRGTAGGDVLIYDGETTALTAALPTIKLLANDIISDPTARAMVADIKDFYLNSDLLRPEFMWINLVDIPSDIQMTYSMHNYAVNGRVLMKLTKGIYGLPQAGFLAQQALIIHLAAHGYEEALHTPCLFTHKQLGTKFTLVVDDFLIKYTSEIAAQHLQDTLRRKYTITTDKSASKYIGIEMRWYYSLDRRVEMHVMTGTQKALARFDITKHPTKDTLAPNKFLQPIYARGRQQQTDEPDTSAALTPEETKELQSMIGAFQYLARAVDSTQLVKLGQLASMQSKATQQTKAEAQLFLQYVATWPAATVTLRPSHMRLKIHSDASYLSEPEAGSRIAGYFFLGNNDDDTDNFVNGAIHVLSVRLDVVVASAAEAEYGGIFHNAKEGVALRNTLADLGHPQPPTVITTDNQVAQNLANDTVKQRRSKAVDMRYHWIRDRIRQGQFNVNWQPGTANLADFFTKLHPPKYHREIRKLYVTDPPRSTQLSLLPVTAID
jgi:hypothetical protein